MPRVVESRNKPFKYCAFADVFSTRSANALLEALEATDGWHLAEKPFYQQYELSLCDAFFDDVPKLLTVDDIEGAFKSVETAFGVCLQRRVEVVAHRMTAGQGIGLHNDSVPGWETHRLTVTLNRGFEDRNGGHLVFFNARDPKAIHCVFRPIHNSAVSFELTPQSYHAVSDVTAGTRHSVVFSFWQTIHPTPVAESIESLIERGTRVLDDRGCRTVTHSGSSLISHLHGTASILRTWGTSKELCLAGLFHSVYGTRAFSLDPRKLALSRREVEGIIGERAEWLVYLYKILTREHLRTLARSANGRDSLLKVNGEYVLVSREELRDLVALDLANTVEQLDRIDMPEDVVRSDESFFEEMRPYLPSPSLVQLARLGRCPS